ncbi:hypothetical protein L218DRAFT_120565 [Marasmius fiardii PR-910]|nr:hypothetical protein L218DRAFT_120565 [Marasmius fiardii PR-910]
MSPANVPPLETVVDQVRSNKRKREAIASGENTCRKKVEDVRDRTCTPRRTQFAIPSAKQTESSTCHQTCNSEGYRVKDRTSSEVAPENQHTCPTSSFPSLSTAKQSGWLHSSKRNTLPQRVWSPR